MCTLRLSCLKSKYLCFVPLQDASLDLGKDITMGDVTLWPTSVPVIDMSMVYRAVQA